MHAVRHAGGVGVPGHEIVHGRPLAHEVMPDEPRPDEVVRAQQLECAGHLPGVEIALAAHHVFQEVNLALVDEQGELSGLPEVGLRRQQRHRLQALVPVTRHGGRGNRQERAAEAVADRVNLAVRHDGVDRIERGHHAELSVVVHPEIPVLCGRVLPGDDEHGEALVRQVPDEGVLPGTGRGCSTS